MVMTLDHVCLMIKKLYKKPADKVAPVERRFLLQQLLLFFRMCHYDNLKELTVILANLLSVLLRQCVWGISL